MDEKKNSAEAELYLAPQGAAEATTVVPASKPVSNEHKDVDAKENHGTTPADEPELQVQEAPKTITCVRERPELRGANRKVFQMSDGTQQAVFYPGPAHIFDDAIGGFVEVDNSLELDDDGRHYHNRRGCFAAKFSCEEENDEMFAVERGMHRITVSMEKNKKNRNQGVRPKLREKVGEATTGTLVFEEVKAGTDVEYTVNADGIKENILVKEKMMVYRYPFLLRCENVTASYDEQAKRVAFLSNETGEEVFFIPAPFMCDANGAQSSGVDYEVRKLSEDGDVRLTVTADRDWINAEERVFPVTIDPQIMVSNSSNLQTYSWVDGRMTSSHTHTVGKTACVSGSNCDIINRMYMHVSMPPLPQNPRIKKAGLTLTQAAGNIASNEYAQLGLYHVNDEICTGDCTPCNNGDLMDYVRVQTGANIKYTFDVTQLVDKFNKNETSYLNLVLKLLDENASCANNVTLYGSGYGNNNYKPQLSITYESSYGVNTSYRTHSHEIGRFGQGSIDLACGNLMFDCQDFAWAGNLFPVTIKHLYNSALSHYQYTNNTGIVLNTADFSAMKLGYGWKLNLMQSVVAAEFVYEGESYNGYVYINENGEEIYFKESTEEVCCESNSQCYYLYADVNGSDMRYDPEKRTLTQGDETYYFDTLGRLFKIGPTSKVDDENYTEVMRVQYSNGRISSVTDGANRTFSFAYSNSFLTSITAPDGTSISYYYTGNLLTSVVYPDGRKAVITYSSYKPTAVTLQTASGNILYKVAYTYLRERLASVTEYGVKNGIFVTGNSSAYNYSAVANRTVITTTEAADEDSEANTIYTAYAFDNDGNVLSQYTYTEDTEKMSTEVEGISIHPLMVEGGTEYSSNSNNLLKDHSFEDLSAWSNMPGNCEENYIGRFPDNSYINFGGAVLCVQSGKTNSIENGVYQITNELLPGQYTFSVYMRVSGSFTGSATAGAYIRVTDTSDNVLAVSERLRRRESQYVRLVVPFELKTKQSVKVQILADGYGMVLADAAQLEKNAYASAYNMLENGSFEGNLNGWSMVAGVAKVGQTASIDKNTALQLVGDVNRQCYVGQQVAVRKEESTRETFTFSGWAKGNGLPVRDGSGTPKFRLRAVINYDQSKCSIPSEEFTSDFSPCTQEWQFASVQFSKSSYGPVANVRVFCDYFNNDGVAYFDDIQLVRSGIETNLTEEDFEDIASDDTGDDAGADVTADTFEEVKDAHGNALTQTTFSDDKEIVLCRAFGYSADGNDLIRETDERGNSTTYVVDEETSRNEEVIDRCGNQTAYEYDASGRTTKVTSKDAQCNTLANVSYSYDVFDNMTQIARGDGMKYVLAYNEFHNLGSIGIQGKNEKLVAYTYKNGNGRLKAITYANGDVMKASYNAMGQMVSEKWYNAANTLTAHYKYTYDGAGNIVRTVDLVGKKEYTYTYDEGQIHRAAESDITVDDNGLITSKTLVNSVYYIYDAEGTLTGKQITTITWSQGSIKTLRRDIDYPQQEDENTKVAQVQVDGPEVYDPEVSASEEKAVSFTSSATTDSLGRKASDSLQLDAKTLTRSFAYHEGQIPAVYDTSKLGEADASTRLVSEITFADGRKLQYTYDEEERITQVVDTIIVDGAEVKSTTTYTYDALGQLLTETLRVGNSGPVVINAMTYDNYGNILTKNGKQYCYDNAAWQDLLTCYDGQTITYDAQGNPTNYLGNVLTWEKGRQLKKFNSNTYTYNANGIRTSKTVDGIKHTYTLDGTKILKESWGSNTLVSLYDVEDSVCGVIYNGTPFYFQKNLQGDIISIVNISGTTVARYNYDAWGACTIAFDASVCNIATINPYRYRSYYYDAEIGMYYLQSRYYDPVVGRFLNSDGLLDNRNHLGANLFAYCWNGPVYRYDATGFNTLDIRVVANPALGTALPFIISGITSSIASIKAAIVSSWFIPVCITLAAIAIAQIVYIVNQVIALYHSAVRVIAAVQTAVRTRAVNSNKLRLYSVYVITRKYTVDVIYVGITKNYTARYNAHKWRFPPSKYTMMPIATGLTYKEARALEQILITAYTLETLVNLINSISPAKWGKFTTEFDQMYTLIESWVDPE